MDLSRREIYTLKENPIFWFARATKSSYLGVGLRLPLHAEDIGFSLPSLLTQVDALLNPQPISKNTITNSKKLNSRNRTRDLWHRRITINPCANGSDGNVNYSNIAKWQSCNNNLLNHAFKHGALLLIKVCKMYQWCTFINKQYWRNITPFSVLFFCLYLT